MYTSHGHQIAGTPVEGDIPKNRARCGGPDLCVTCGRESVRAVQNLQENKIETGTIEPQDGTAGGAFKPAERYSDWTPLFNIPDNRGPIFCTCLECGAAIMGFPYIEEIEAWADATEIHNEWHDQQDRIKEALRRVSAVSNTIGIGEF